MGDTNEWRTEAGCLSELEPEFHIAPTGPSFHARHPVAQLDRIIVHRDLNIEAAGVHMSAAARRASDHLPIWARVALTACEGEPSLADLPACDLRRRWIDEPMPIASRYLTTVRRATSKPLLLQQAGDGVVAQDFGLGVDQLPDSGLDRLGRGAVAFGRRDARAEEIFELVEPAVAQQIFVRGDPADGRFVHADRLGDFAQRHRLHRRHAALEEALLALHDLADTTLTIVRARWSSALTSQLALCRHSLSQARDALSCGPDFSS